MSRREEFIEDLKEMIEYEDGMSMGDIDEIIYIIDDLIIYGDFYSGSRSADHAVLLFDDMTWEDLINWGTVVVPENKTYISNQINIELNSNGFSNLPIDDNHIIKKRATKAEHLSLNERLDQIEDTHRLSNSREEASVIDMDR